MKRRILSLAVSVITINTYAQVPEDALRMSWITPSGTARSQAIGRAIGALGGDISSIFVNPAGLGFFKTGTLVLTPGYNFLKNKSSFRGTDASSENKNNFTLGTSGIVFAYGDRFNERNSNAISIAINRTADFNSVIYYKGLNTLSSYSEQFLEELRNNNADTNSVYDFPFTSGLAYYTYLIDTIKNPNGSFGGFKSLAPLSTGLNQERTISSSGGITEIALGFASNHNDKLYLGGSLGIPIMNYKRTTTFRESDATNDPANEFNYSEYIQYYSSQGAGVNLKLGAIFKPIASLRLGLGLHTPTLFGLSEKSSASMTTDTENYPPSPGIVSVSSDELNNNERASFKYNLVSPWKFLLSGAYIFGETENVRNQKGFISADLEYITYGSSRFSSMQSDNSDDAYYTAVNDATKQSYKGAFNFRMGGELKFNVLMLRAGFGYYGNPYKDAELKASRTNISGGLGYRNKGFFLDLTYNYQKTKDVNFPYRLEDKPNTFATIQGTGGNMLLTFGVKF